ncbi:MAG: polysaccharide deacetylase family protein [Planctomycetaceae bacterium]|nr:polysaccharide deacetylase family protein [Planctomycetaceae bacterium]
MSDYGRYHGLTRRDLLIGCATASTLGYSARSSRHADAIETEGHRDKALIAISFDLEMSRNFPTRDTTHWDYEKGNLNEETKRYSLEAARRVKEAGAVMHFFAVGRVFEQESVDWLRQIADAGHPIGNHTYDHVNVTATTLEDVQVRFKRSPWLASGKPVADLIRDNVRLCELAMQSRLGIKPAGFRTPGGFSNGLRDRPDVRAMLKGLGYEWISSLYPSHPNTAPMQQPSREVIDAIVAAQEDAQPFVYPDGLVEIPMSPISDIGAFRTGQWKLEWFLAVIRESVKWAIEHRAVFDFLAHPSCLYVVDPDFKAIDLICDLVGNSNDHAEIVGLDSIAERVST